MHASRGTRAAHRIEVHHRAPAAAGNLRAEHGVVELRIVGGELDPHILPLAPSSSLMICAMVGSDVLAMSALPQVTVTIPSGAIEYQTLDRNWEGAGER